MPRLATVVAQWSGSGILALAFPSSFLSFSFPLSKWPPASFPKVSTLSSLPLASALAALAPSSSCSPVAVPLVPVVVEVEVLAFLALALALAFALSSLEVPDRIDLSGRSEVCLLIVLRKSSFLILLGSVEGSDLFDKQVIVADDILMQVQVNAKCTSGCLIQMSALDL